MKALRFLLLALALLLQGGGAWELEAAEPPASCCCEDRCPCPMPPQAPRAPQAPTALQVTAAPAAEQATPAQAPRMEARAWDGLPLDVPTPEARPGLREIRPDPAPPGGRQHLLQTALLRI
jgi:hypothetical protein